VVGEKMLIYETEGESVCIGADDFSSKRGKLLGKPKIVIGNLIAT
jgi:hypothetical protein